MRSLLALAVALVGFHITGAYAQHDPADVLKTLHFQRGVVHLGDNLADIAQTADFRYLNNADTQSFLTNVWANPPGAGANALGMLLPADKNPLTAEGWAVVVSYEASGYVSDQDAKNIDYDALMRQMQQDVAEASKQRVEHGQSSIELLGWARKPYYDAAEKKLYWAKRLRFGGSSHETLNYEIRILGRRGVLDLNVVAPMAALPTIDQRVSTILSMVHFNSGNTYAEFDPKIDTAAAYGVAGLIAGGVLVKAGFFKGLIALLIASKKLLAIGFAAAFAGAWGAIKKVFGRNRKPATESAASSPVDGTSA